MDSTTSPSLLVRVRSRADAKAWERFVQLYTPLLFYWAQRACPSRQDADDLVQEVFAALLEKLPQFEYRTSVGQKGQFRAWLRIVTLNKWREMLRRKSRTRQDIPLDQAADPSLPSELEDFWQKDYEEFILARALEIMQAEFSPKAWNACWQTTIGGRTAANVGTELGMTEGAVYVAKSRVLSRLREEFAELLDD